MRTVRREGRAGVLRPRPEKRSAAVRCGAVRCGAQGCAGELLITRAVHSLSCSVSNQGGSWGFRGIKYGLRVNHGRRGLVALTGKSVWGSSGPTERAGGEGGREGAAAAAVVQGLMGNIFISV